MHSNIKKFAGPYSTIFCTKCERVSFLPSKGKNWTSFFKNRKLISTWLRSMNRYYELKVHTLKMFLSYYYDIQYSKHFSSFFWLKNENYAWFINKNSIKIFFQVLDITYHDKLLEICLGACFSYPIIFEKKVQFFFWKAKSYSPMQATFF